MGDDLEKRVNLGVVDHKPHSGSEMLGEIDSGQEILALQDLDPAMNKKMHLVNNVWRNLQQFNVGSDTN